MHNFFIEIKKYPELEKHCRTDLTILPKPYKGKEKIKAILLGADPTNNGIKGKEGLIELVKVFGINSEFERSFFGPQRTNLNAIGLTKENLYIQNVCRNYFADQTSENKYWSDIAKLWLKYLEQELAFLDANLPVFITAERIMRLLVSNAPSAKDIYTLRQKPPFLSEVLNRRIIPLYRHPKYLLSANWNEYKLYIMKLINE
jgi:hypothetical protein